MKLKYLALVFFTAITGFVISTTQSGCANQVPPTGGPRDSLPPMLLRVTPVDSTLKFTGKKILLSFDEYVQLDNVQKNVVINPTPKINPTIEQKLKTISITIRDTLEENTTYSIDFGNSIKDLNEGNPFRNYQYLFSTGTRLDSLAVSGKVLIAQTGKADSTLIVMLHTNFDDSAVIKDKPRYTARVDTSGNFMFNNLAPGRFAIYALKDDGAKRYLSKEQLFAFGDSAIETGTQPRNIMLYAFLEKDTAQKSTSTISLPDEEPENNLKRGERARPQVLKIQTNLSDGRLDLLSNLELNFSPVPLRKFDSTKVILTDTAYKPLTGYHFKMDTSNKKVTLIYPWPENTQYNLLLDSTFAEDTSGKKLLRSDTLSFQTKTTTDYGSVRLRFTNLQLDKSPLLQFIQGDAVKFSHAFKNNQFSQKLFPPGEYELRIVFDENKNGEWDTGQFFKQRRQPEKVQRIDRKINVKANWDNEVDITL